MPLSLSSILGALANCLMRDSQGHTTCPIFMDDLIWYTIPRAINSGKYSLEPFFQFYKLVKVNTFQFCQVMKCSSNLDLHD